MDLKDTIRSIKDFPEEGIIFRDITTLLKDPKALKLAVDTIEEKLDGVDYDVIVAPESRGFIFGMPLAYNKGQKVVIVDDLLATGGTAKAMIELVESVGAEVSALCFLIELDALNGRECLKDYNVKTILHY